MKLLGVVFLVVGLIVGAYGFAMDTTVASDIGRVHNVGLMSDRQSTLIAGGVLAVIGTILAAFASSSRAALMLPPGSSAEAIQRLNKAIATGDIAMVKALLTDDIDVTQENEWGASPIKVAKGNERTEILAMLQAHQRAREAAKAASTAS